MQLSVTMLYCLNMIDALHSVTVVMLGLVLCSEVLKDPHYLVNHEIKTLLDSQICCKNFCCHMALLAI